MKTDIPNAKMLAFSKIQQVQPTHYSNLINKQVGSIVHIEMDKTYKIKNCVDSEKTNSQLYKRYSKQFIANIRKGENQMIFCCGLQEIARLQTSVGSKKNPGLFLITGIGILDEKYQEDFTKFDIQISFMEYIDGKLYDLLSYTREPLRMVKKDENICFGQTYCKVTTFNQFLKLLKIALFNNKQRDIKMEGVQNSKENLQIKSSFIMTIITKKYSNYGREKKTVMQKNIVIDFAQSKFNSNLQENGTQKTLWDYIVIQFNNLTNKKKLYYHLVQSNPLLSIIKFYLKYGTSCIISSLSTNPQCFQHNYKFLTEIADYVDLITLQLQNNTQTQSITTALQKNTQLTLSKYISQTQMVQIITKQIQSLAQIIKSKKYSSLRHYRQLKQKNLLMITFLYDWIQVYQRIFSKKLENKRKLKLQQTQIVTDQIKLIGVCVKSDHYKDFYEAKSYLSLGRQIEIKTEESRFSIIKFIKIRSDIKEKFYELKNKHFQIITSIDFGHEKEASTKNLALYVLQFFAKIFFNLVFYSQRTLIDQVLREQNIIQNLNLLSKQLVYFKKQICEMSKQGKILFELSNFKKDAHLIFLIKQVQNIAAQEYHKKIQYKNIYKKKNVLKQNFQQTQKQEHKVQNQNKFTKLPNLSQKRISFQLPGNFNLSSLLFNPNANFNQ